MNDPVESNEFSQIRNQILEDLKKLAKTTPLDASNNHSAFSGSLSLALCCTLKFSRKFLIENRY
jgi:hypothetical protein